MDSQGSTRSPDEYEAPRDCMEVIQNLESSVQAAEQDAPATTDPSTPKCASSTVPGSTVHQESEDITQVLMKKLSVLRVPEVRKLRKISPSPADDMSGCSQCEESEDSDDDDLCSTTSSDDTDQVEGNSSQDPFIQPPMLPDVHIHVPLESEDDVVRVRRALLIKGVLEVSCDLERQIVTVSGNVAPRRLLKKVKQVNRNSRILSSSSSSSSFAGFFLTSGHHASNTMGMNDQPSPGYAINPPHIIRQHSNGYNSAALEYPSAQESMLVAPRPRPTYQTYTFRNRPSSPYLRTYSPSDMSPPSSPPDPEFAAWDSAIRYYNSTRSYVARPVAAHSMSFDHIFDHYYYE